MSGYDKNTHEVRHRYQCDKCGMYGMFARRPLRCPECGKKAVHYFCDCLLCRRNDEFIYGVRWGFGAVVSAVLVYKFHNYLSLDRPLSLGTVLALLFIFSAGVCIVRSFNRFETVATGYGLSEARKYIYPKEAKYDAPDPNPEHW